MECLLKLKRAKKTNKEGKQDFVNRQKMFFENIMTMNLVFQGLPVYLNKYDEGLDICFDKFTIGGEMAHSTKVPDFRRIERIGWIPIILNNLSICNQNCPKIKMEINKKQNRTLIYCDEKTYILVLKRIKDRYILLTAYSISNDKKKQNKLRNSIL